MNTNTQNLLNAIRKNPSVATSSKKSLMKRFKVNSNDLISINEDLKEARSIYFSNKQKSINLEKKQFIEDNIYKEPSKTEIDNNSFIDYFNSYLKDIKLNLNKNQKKNSKVVNFDRLVFTDMHIGMHIDINDSLYDLQWNEEILFERLAKMIEIVKYHKRSDHLFINDLGDSLDGFSGQTTRGGHSLPQNLSNVESFKTLVSFKDSLIRELSKIYDTIDLVNVTNSNHDAEFSLVAHTAIKDLLELKYDNVTVYNQTKFLDIYRKGNYNFVLTHGKDGKYMKFGLPVKITGLNLVKINNALINLGAFEKDKKVEFCKGDSHLFLVDEASSDLFSYTNFPAFSPSSNWVQHNFSKGNSGFVFFNYFEDYKVTVNYKF